MPGGPPPAQPLAFESAQLAAGEEAARQGFERGRAEGFGQGLGAGRDEGLRKGLQEAAEQGRARVEQAVLEATQSVRAMQEQLYRLEAALRPAFAACMSAAEDELVALCYETLCSILGAQALQPAVVQAHVQHVLSRAAGAQSIALHLHPQDAELLASCAAGVDDPTAAARIRCVPDPEVQLGGCIVRSEGGGLDARLETALLACKDALVSARRNHRRVPCVEPEARS